MADPRGLVEKYQTETNRKNVLLKPTEKALAIYEEKSNRLDTEMFEDFFKNLDGFDDETLNRILKDTAAEKDKCKFQIQVNEVTGISDTTPYRKLYALMDILGNFANREIKERGTHDELMSIGGQYSHMVELTA